MHSKDDPARTGLRDLSTSSDDVAQYYDDWAADYDATLQQWQYEAPEQVAGRLRSHLDGESLVLDAGCGTGLSGAALAAAGFRTIDGMDVSQQSLAVAAERGVYRSLQQVDMQRLPLPYADNAYAGLVCVGVLTYVPDSAGILRELARIVRADGVLLLTQRSDLLIERDFPATLEALQAEGLFTTFQVSEPRPYLPANAEFRDDIRVHYITCLVAPR